MDWNDVGKLWDAHHALKKTIRNILVVIVIPRYEVGGGALLSALLRVTSIKQQNKYLLRLIADNDKFYKAQTEDEDGPLVLTFGGAETWQTW